MRRHLALGLCLVTLGCHTFQPVGIAELDPGMEVRARVSASQAEELTAYLPTERDRLIEGTVLDTSPGELFLAVPVTVRNVPGQRETLRQRIVIPTDEILEVELRNFDRQRTGVLSAVGALIVGYILYESLKGGSSGGTPGDGGPGTQDALIPLRIPFGR